MKTQASYWVLGHKITPHHTTGDYNLVKGESPAGAQGPPPHIHRHYEELFYILSGEMDFVLDGNPRVVRAGELVNIPCGCLHTFSNTNDQSCSWINIHSPKGFQSFFDAFGVLENKKDAARQSLSPDTIQSVLKRAVEFDMEIRPPQ